MTSEYIAVLQNLKTGRITSTLPASVVKGKEVLNGPGGVDCTIPLNPGHGLTKEDITPRRNAVFVTRDDVVVAEGIIETYNLDVKNNTLQLSCLGWHNWTRSVHLKTNASYSGIDQTMIAKALMDYATGRPGALSITTTNVVASGVLRTRSEWFGYDRHPVGELIDNLAAVLNGFNFRYRSTRGAQGYTTEFLTSYPASGRVTNFVLEMGGNVELLGMSCDGSQMANNAEVIGGGQGSAARIGSAVDTSLLATTPWWETVATATDVTVQATLDAKAGKLLGLSREPIEIPRLRLGADAEPRIGQYHPGDRVRIRGEYGLFDIDADYVITQLDLDVSPDAEFIDVAVAPVGAFQ